MKLAGRDVWLARGEVKLAWRDVWLAGREVKLVGRDVSLAARHAKPAIRGARLGRRGVEDCGRQPPMQNENVALSETAPAFAVNVICHSPFMKR